nr:MAG TPA: hypothetical protein [Caudoviricetes sp.]
MTDNDWQGIRTLGSLRYRNHYRGYSPFVFEIIQELSRMNHGDFSFALQALSLE